MVPTLADQARRLNRRARHPVPPLVLMTDPRIADPLALALALPPGCAVILRHYGDPGREELGRALARLCRKRRLLLLVAADARLATTLGADGVHLPEGLARGGHRRHRGLLSVAAHGLPALLRARRAGADWATLSPVFATDSHPGAPILGRGRFALLVRRAGLPVLALGGVTARSVRSLRRSGAAGVATVSGIRASAETCD